MTVREIVHACQREVRDTDLQPDRAAELLNRLSAMLGNVNDEIRIADAEYAAKLLFHLETAEKANRARIIAECSPEYQRKREARDTKELVVEMMRSLKYFIKAKSDEMRLTQ